MWILLKLKEKRIASFQLLPLLHILTLYWSLFFKTYLFTLLLFALRFLQIDSAHAHLTLGRLFLDIYLYILTRTSLALFFVSKPERPNHRVSIAPRSLYWFTRGNWRFTRHHGLTTDTPYLLPIQRLRRLRLAVPASDRNAGVPRLHLPHLLVPPSRLRAAPPVGGAHRPELHVPTWHPRRSILSDPQELRLLPRQLSNPNRARAGGLAHHASVLALCSLWPPRVVVVPLPLSPFGSASSALRTHLRRSRNPRDPRCAHRVRYFPHQRWILVDLCIDGWIGDRVLARRVPRSRGSVSRRSGAEQLRIPLVPRWRRRFSRRAGRRARVNGGIWTNAVSGGFFSGWFGLFCCNMLNWKLLRYSLPFEIQGKLLRV